jgi:WD40 repeat protein
MLPQVWAGAASGVLLGQHVGHTAPVTCLTLDGSLLFSGAQDGSIRMWDVLPPFFVSHSQQQTARPLSSSTAARSAADAAAGRQRPVASSSAFAVLKGHSGAVTGLAVAAESGVLVSCGVDGQVLQWDYVMRQVVGRYCLEGQGLSCLAVGPDAQQVFLGTSHGQLLTVPGSGHVVCGAASTTDCQAACHSSDGKLPFIE